MKPHIVLSLLTATVLSNELPQTGLLLDLDAAKGVAIEDDGKM